MFEGNRWPTEGKTPKQETGATPQQNQEGREGRGEREGAKKTGNTKQHNKTKGAVRTLMIGSFLRVEKI